MHLGQDTSAIGNIPTFTNFSKVAVAPGADGVVAFDLTNRYNQQMLSARLRLEFRIGGDWLDAQPVANLTNPPSFAPGPMEQPRTLDPNQTIHLEFPFSTSPQTPPGVYLVAIVLLFSYLNDTNFPTGAIFRSLGNLSKEEREKVNMSDYNGTIAALGVDGIAPDTSIVVDSGGAGALVAAAAVGGAAVFVAGAAAGTLVSRRRAKKGR